jgi:acetoacetate decarboxylase
MATTSWVKSLDEIKKIEDVLAAPAFLEGRTLTVSYLTRPEIIRQILPPPLEPATEPLVSVGVGTFGSSNCVGACRRMGRRARALQGYRG